MKQVLRYLLITFALCLSVLAAAQMLVQYNPNHGQLLSSQDTRLASNKRLVYDFWREVLEAERIDLAEKYLTENFMEHNPTVPTGRAEFVKYFSKIFKAKPIEAKVKKPIVAIVAEGDYVIMTFREDKVDPKDASKKYTTTWFDMFRVKDGKIAEHWDPEEIK